MFGLLSSFVIRHSSFPSLAFLLIALQPASAAVNPKAHTFDSNGVSIYYTLEGKGEPVVLIHGLFSSGQMNWGSPGIVKMLATNFQVITMDVRGHGHSDKPKDEASYGVEMVEDVVRLLDHLNIQKAHIVGYSMGGLITMKLLTRHPERVKSAVLGGMGWLREGSQLQELWRRLPSRSRRRPPGIAANSFPALAVTEQEVKAIKVPVAVLIGDRDPVRKAYVEPLEKIRPDWPVKLIANAGHFVCFAKPQFKRELKAWLEGQGDE